MYANMSKLQERPSHLEKLKMLLYQKLQPACHLSNSWSVCLSLQVVNVMCQVFAWRSVLVWLKSVSCHDYRPNVSYHSLNVNPCNLLLQCSIERWNEREGRKRGIDREEDNGRIERRKQSENQLALKFVAIQVLAPITFRRAQHCTVFLASLVQSPHSHNILIRPSFIVIIRFELRSPKKFLPFKLSKKYIFFFSRLCYMYHPSHNSFNSPNNTSTWQYNFP